MQSKLHKIEYNNVLSEVLKKKDNISISLITALDKVVVAEELLKGLYIRVPIADFENQINR